MGSSGARRLAGFRVWGWMGIGLVLGGTAWAQAPGTGRVPRGAVPSPGQALRVPLRPQRFLTSPSEPQAYDACLVAVPDVDPRFTVPAPQVDEHMIVAPRVAGLYRGTLAPRR